MRSDGDVDKQAKPKSWALYSMSSLVSSSRRCWSAEWSSFRVAHGDTRAIISLSMGAPVPHSGEWVMIRCPTPENMIRLGTFIGWLQAERSHAGRQTRSGRVLEVEYEVFFVAILIKEQIGCCIFLFFPVPCPNDPTFACSAFSHPTNTPNQ
jgi:hypothetical protein